MPIIHRPAAGRGKRLPVEWLGLRWLGQWADCRRAAQTAGGSRGRWAPQTQWRASEQGVEPPDRGKPPAANQ